MSISEYDPSIAARDVRFDEERMTVELADGRAVSVPLSWYPRLEHATAAQRANWRLIGAGSGIHWPDIDEDVSMFALVQGLPSVETRSRK